MNKWRGPLTLNIGAHPYPSGTEFRVWATNPKCVEVEILLEDGSSSFYELEPEGNGYFKGFVSDALPGMNYKYRLDSKESFPDPASRYQPEGVHGPSQIIDPSVFNWTDEYWQGAKLNDLIIYEIHVGTFTQEGTFDAIIDRLEHICKLGATAIQLMPIADFPGERDWGYNGVHMFAPARTYGGPDSLKRLINTAHIYNLAVILDVVFNHFGPEGNYLEKFSTSYFSQNHHTDWGKAINYVEKSGRPVRDFFISNACYWAHEYHIDGLRLDAVQAIRDNDNPHIVAEIAISVHTSLPDNRSFIILAEDGHNDPELVLPITMRGFGLDAVYADDFRHQIYSALTNDHTGYYEDYTGSMDDLVATIQQGWWFIGQISKWKSKKLGKTTQIGQNPNMISPPHFLYCIENHDHIGNRPLGERLNHLVTLESYRTVSALLLLLPYTPLIFMGQEWGASTPFQFFTNYSNKDAIDGLIDGRLKDIKDRSPNFHKVLPHPQEEKTFLNSKITWREKSITKHSKTFQLYCDLINLRKSLPALNKRERKDFNVIKISTHALALRRKGISTKDTILIIANLQGRLEYNLLTRLDTAPPTEDYTWKLELDTEDSKYNGNGDTKLINGELIEINRPATVVLSLSSKLEDHIKDEIFISYARGGESGKVATHLYNFFKTRNITIHLDTKNIEFKGSIQSFMEKLGKGKAIILIISDKYLKSASCMFELIEISKNGSFYNRIFPLYIGDTQIYQPEERIKYIQFWEQKIEQLNKKAKEINSLANLEGIYDDINQYTEIRNTISKLMTIIKDMNCSLKIHEQDSFEKLFQKIQKQNHDFNKTVSDES